MIKPSVRNPLRSVSLKAMSATYSSCGAHKPHNALQAGLILDLIMYSLKEIREHN